MPAVYPGISREQGRKGYNANTNGGFLAPADAPKAIVSTLNPEINAALKMPDVRAKRRARCSV